MRTDHATLGPDVKLTFGDVRGRPVGQAFDVGFLLYIKEGRLDSLECHVWGEGTLNEMPTLSGLSYVRHERPGHARIIPSETRDESALPEILTH